MHDDYDGFGIRIQEEDNVLIAYFIEWPEIAASGPTVTTVLIRLKAVWDAKKGGYIS
jgi:predicted RNase H-like HicB family nuclease